MADNKTSEEYGEKVRMQYGAPFYAMAPKPLRPAAGPALNAVGTVANFLAPATPMASVIFAFLFPILTGLAAFLGMSFLAPMVFGGFTASAFVAVVYGIITFLLTALLSIGYISISRRKEPPKFLQQAFRFNRQRLAEHRTRKNQKDFLQTVLIVILFMSYHFVVMKLLGKAQYPSEAFTLYIPIADNGITITRIEPVAMSWSTLVIMWGFLIWILPRFGVYALLLLMHVTALFLQLFGAIMFLQQAPFLLMAPLFMFANFLMMFGPLAFINVMQIKTILPGESGGDEGKEVRGQPHAKKQLERALYLFASEEGEAHARKGARPPRGILLKGPPGTGKTLFAKWAASVLNCPVVITTGAAYVATFLGVDILVALITKWMLRSAAKDYGKKAILFVDEGEQLFMRRQGMTGSVPGMSMEKQFWSLFQYNQYGAMSPCGLTVNSAVVREICEERANANVPTVHRQMFPGMFGGGMGSMAIYVFLPWIDGFDAPPFLEKFVRSKLNYLLDVIWLIPPVCFIPTYFARKKFSLRLGPAKPDVYKELFLIATNRPQVLDPAILRPGRISMHVDFVMPDEAGREDIIKFYLLEWKHEDGTLKIAHHPELEDDKKIKEMARSTQGLSPAAILEVLQHAVDISITRIYRMKQLEDQKEAGQPFDDLEKEEWQKYEKIMQEPGWDTVQATWSTLIEAISEQRHGPAQPPPPTVEAKKSRVKLQRNVAFHEVGHLAALNAFCRKFQKATFLSVIQHGDALGLVEHAPLEERENMVQWKIEGLIRTALGSLAAEHIFLKDGDSSIGTSSDLRNATTMAIQMALNWAMPPRKCSKEETKRYEEIGETILSLPEIHVEMPGSPGPFAALTMFSGKRRNLAVVLGQAYVDDWRALNKCKDVVPPMVERVVAKGELTGGDVEELWEELNQKLQPLEPGDNTWPEMASANKFYDKDFNQRSEGDV